MLFSEFYLPSEIVGGRHDGLRLPLQVHIRAVVFEYKDGTEERFVRWGEDGIHDYLIPVEES